MGIITKIQSISDVITNSSSEVFVMTEENAKYYENLEDTNDCISIEPITIDWLRSWYGMSEWEMVCEICDLDPSEIQGEYHRQYDYYDGPDEETWEEFLEFHKDVIEEKMNNLYWVDIEDHFSDAQSVNDSARSDSLWHDYRH